MNPNASIFDPSFVTHYNPYEQVDDYSSDNRYYETHIFTESNQIQEIVETLVFDTSENLLWTGTETVSHFTCIQVAMHP